jgi:hypothetical protein
MKEWIESFGKSIMAKQCLAKNKTNKQKVSDDPNGKMVEKY